MQNNSTPVYILTGSVEDNKVKTSQPVSFKFQQAFWSHMKKILATKRIGIQNGEQISLEYFVDTLNIPQESTLRVFDLNGYTLPDGDFLYTANEQGSSNMWVAQYLTKDYTVRFIENKIYKFGEFDPEPITVQNSIPLTKEKYAELKQFTRGIVDIKASLGQLLNDEVKVYRNVKGFWN